MLVGTNYIGYIDNGSILHRFPSALPNGSKRDISGPVSSYSILDCIFHEPDQTYCIIDMICWRGYSLYDCTAEFRFFWVNSKLMETSAGDPPSTYHRYRFSVVLIYECTPYAKDGLLFRFVFSVFLSVYLWVNELDIAPRESLLVSTDQNY